jgi:hypothetical protein
MKNLLKNILVILLIGLPFISLAQDNCRGIQRFCAPSNKKEGFVYNGQSVFGAFAQGDTAEVSIVVYKNMDYRIVLCSGDEALDGKIEFKVVEMISKPYWEETKVLETVEEFDAASNSTVKKQVEKIVKKRVYARVESVRYDNTKYESDPEFSFTSDKTRKLIIKVYIPEMGENVSNGLDEDAMSCVGMLIEHKQAEKTGFRRR